MPDRRRETLLLIIEQWILPGRRIISDGWTSHADVQQISNGIYINDITVHQRNFVNLNHPTMHTQLIENAWMRAKKKLYRQHGTSGLFFHSYKAEIYGGKELAK